MEQLELNIPLKLNWSSELGTSRGATIGVPKKVVKRERPDMSGPISLALVIICCVLIWAYWDIRWNKDKARKKVRDRRTKSKRKRTKNLVMPF